MKKITVSMMLVVLAAFVVRVSVSLAARERGTPQEAKAMLHKAVEHYKSVGRSQALADFNGQKGAWVDRDLYVWCIDRNHIVIANSIFSDPIGKSLDMMLKNFDGKPVGQAAWEALSKTDEGSIKYPAPNPVSGKVEPKTSFLKKVGDDLCGVGIYIPQ